MTSKAGYPALKFLPRLFPRRSEPAPRIAIPAPCKLYRISSTRTAAKPLLSFFLCFEHQLTATRDAIT
jgi:hypothetical protein